MVCGHTLQNQKQTAFPYCFTFLPDALIIHNRWNRLNKDYCLLTRWFERVTELKIQSEVYDTVLTFLLACFCFHHQASCLGPPSDRGRCWAAGLPRDPGVWGSTKLKVGALFLIANWGKLKTLSRVFWKVIFKNLLVTALLSHFITNVDQMYSMDVCSRKNRLGSLLTELARRDIADSLWWAAVSLASWGLVR